MLSFSHRSFFFSNTGFFFFLLKKTLFSNVFPFFFVLPRPKKRPTGPSASDLRSLHFGRDFNQAMEHVKLPRALQELTLGFSFNQKLGFKRHLKGDIVLFFCLKVLLVFFSFNVFWCFFFFCICFFCNYISFLEGVPSGF